MGKLNTNFQRSRKETTLSRQKENIATAHHPINRAMLYKEINHLYNLCKRSVYTSQAAVISTMMIVYVSTSCLSAILILELLDVDFFQKVLFYGEIYVWWNLSAAILMAAVLFHDNLKQAVGEFDLIALAAA